MPETASFKIRLFSPAPKLICAGERLCQRSPIFRTSYLHRRSHVPKVASIGGCRYQRSPEPDIICIGDHLHHPSLRPETACTEDLLYRRPPVPDATHTGDNLYRRSPVAERFLCRESSASEIVYIEIHYISCSIKDWLHRRPVIPGIAYIEYTVYRRPPVPKIASTKDGLPRRPWKQKKLP